MHYGLALGSGGARGAAHLALIEVLKYRKIDIEIVTGSSAGAIVGAYFALYPESNLTEVFQEIIKENKKKIFSNFKVLNRKISNFPKLVASKSFLKNEFVYDIYKGLYGKKKFSDCKIKLGVVSYDLESGEEVEITEGYIIDAVMASSSVPGVFPPLRLGGMELLDGGILNPIPVNFAKKLGSDYVIASDLNEDEIKNFEFDNGLEYLISIDDYKNQFLVKKDLENADEVYNYKIGFSWNDFDHFTEIYQQSKQQISENFQQEGVLQ